MCDCVCLHLRRSRHRQNGGQLSFAFAVGKTTAPALSAGSCGRCGNLPVEAVASWGSCKLPVALSTWLRCMTDRSYQKVVRLQANERFRCADNVAALISCLLPSIPPLSLYPPLSACAPFLYSSLPSLFTGLVQPTLCFSVLGICLARSNPPPAPRLHQYANACPLFTPSPPPPSACLPHTCHTCPNTDRNRESLPKRFYAKCRASIMLPALPLPPLPPIPPPSLVFLFLYTCCSCCSLCSLFLLLLLPSCSCCSLTNCVASSLSRQAPRRTCCHLAAMRQLLLSLPLRWLWQVESRLGWSNCESYQDDQGVNKFIQSFIETNWLTDDDDDDGDDDDDAQEWGKWVSERDRQTGRTCHSGSGSNNKAQHACQSGYLSRSSAHPFNFCLHFKSCVWAAMSDELPLYTPAPPPSPAALPPPHDCCPTLVACQLCCNSVYFVIRQRRRIFGMQMPEMETEMETETEKETDTGHPILGQCITITGHK